MRTREIDGRADPDAALRLEEGWQRVVERGGLAYDPVETERVRAGRVTFHYLPGRLRRPGGATNRAPGVDGVLTPHTPCPFDDPRTLEIRGVLRLGRHDRQYHIITNKFPVKRLHFLAVRSAAAADERLPQCIFGADEIEDMLLVARMLGPPYRFYFNSNAGGDGSSSGSSVNHWHFQILPDPGDVLERLPPGQIAPDGGVPGWGMPHRGYRSADTGRLADRLWNDIQRAVEMDIAFNLALCAREDGEVATAFFARAPVPPLRIGNELALPNEFGGFELTGAAVVYEKPAIEWIRKHPAQAEDIAWERLLRGARDIWTPSRSP